MTEQVVEEARQRAEEVLRANVRDFGILSAAHAYQQVHARDSMISALGLLLTSDPALRDVPRRSLETLTTGQSRLGNIPFSMGIPNVADESLLASGGTFAPQEQDLEQQTGQQPEPRSKAPLAQAHPVSDTMHAGCVDNALWYILGHYAYYMAQRDHAFLSRHWQNISRAYLWLQYQDVNECGLLEVHEAMDWADLFANRYNVLYDNVLWCAAHQAMGHLAQALANVKGKSPREYFQEAESTRFKLNLLLWVGPETKRDLDWVQQHRQEWLYPIRRTDTELVSRPYYLPYMAYRDYADRCDALGNLLAILFGTTNQAQSDRILNYIYGVGMDMPWPMRVLYPVVLPGEPDWREYYLVRNLNRPHHYHNGGIWPFVGGFYVAALVKAGRESEAQRQVVQLAELNRLGREQSWEFNEWFHGESGRPMGFAGQSWSAAMYIYAYEAVTKGVVPFFGVGWQD